MWRRFICRNPILSPPQKNRERDMKGREWRTYPTRDMKDGYEHKIPRLANQEPASERAQRTLSEDIFSIRQAAAEYRCLKRKN